MGGRSRIEGAVPAGRVGGQDATPQPVSVKEDFAGVEPDEPSEKCFPGGLSEQGTAGGHEHQVKIDQF